MPGYVLDASWARHGWAAVKAAGFTGVMLYLSNDPSKNCKPGDVTALAAAGLELTLNWEAGNGDPVHTGQAGGVTAAQRANAQADALGYPRTSVIYYSCDTDASPDQVRAYYQGVKSVGIRPAGAYGGAVIVLAMLHEGVTQFAWVANAGSWDHGVSDAGAHLHQHYHTHNVLPVPAGWGLNDYDESLVLRADYGQWGVGAPQEDDLDANQAAQLQAIYNAFNTGAATKNANVISDIHNWAQALFNRTGGSADPKAIADAVVGSVGPAVAKSVADEIAKRLAA